MIFTDAEIRKLSAADGQRGWQAIPDGCPPKFAAMIMETRARRLGMKRSAAEPPAPQVDAEALRERLKAVSLF